MCKLESSDTTKIIILSILYTVQLAVFFYSTILLTRRKTMYPIKQLSPQLTLMISISIMVVSTILLITKFAEMCQPYDTDNAIVAVLSILYTFFRQFIIIAFYMRCLRICTAYFKVQKAIIILIFSNQLAIALVTSIISVIPAICQFVQFLVHKNINRMTNFFPFYTRNSIANQFDFIYIWVFDNALFFVVLVLSLTVHQRFKFLKSLIMACVLFHIETIYNLIGMFVSDVNDQLELRNDYQYVIMVIHTIFLMLILVPSLQPNEYQFPLPIENTLLNHNTALLDNETYILISQFADKLETRSQTEEERKRKASSWLVIYTTFKIAQRRIAKIQLEPPASVLSQTEDNIKIREILEDYVFDQVIPNLNIKMIKDNVQELFFENEEMCEETVREDLEIEHFQKLGKVLDTTVSAIFREWRKTMSYEELKKQFRENMKIINTMTKLKIAIAI